MVFKMNISCSLWFAGCNLWNKATAMKTSLACISELGFSRRTLNIACQCFVGTELFQFILTKFCGIARFDKVYKENQIKCRPVVQFGCLDSYYLVWAERYTNIIQTCGMQFIIGVNLYTGSFFLGFLEYGFTAIQDQNTLCFVLVMYKSL